MDDPGLLVIFDNLDTSHAAQAIEDLLPRLRGGTVLMTGRIADWPAEIEALEVDVLDEDNAAGFRWRGATGDGATPKVMPPMR